MMDSIVLQQSSSSTACGGGRAIDRHNPIIRDEKRLTQTNPHHHQRKSKETTNKDLKQEADAGDQKKKSVAFADGDDDEFIKPRDFISPATSARCLLSDKDTFNYSSEFDHVPPPPPPPPCEPLISHNGKAFKKKDEPLKIDFNEAFKKKDDDLLSSPPPLSPPPSCEGLRFFNSDDNSLSSSPPNPPPLPPPDQPLEFHNYKASNKKQEDSLSSATAKPPSPPPSSSDQVVVLDVSLHCRGCERKMRKHISKIEGVTSFKIEFAAKKVTVVGDVTPLAVLTSVLKVKNAKLLIPATISSSSLTDSKH